MPSSEGQIGKLARTNGVVLIGDSVGRGGTGGNGGSPLGATVFRNSRDALAWANLFSNGQVRYLRNSGIDGDMVGPPPLNTVSAGVAGRLGSDALAYLPAVVIMQVGRNDIVLGESFALYQSLFAQAIRQCLAFGVIPLVWGLTPDSNMGGVAPTTALRVWNLALAEICRQNGALFLDIFPLLVDPTTGLWNTNTLYYDGSHFSTRSARVIGLALAKLLAPYLPAYQPPALADQAVYSTAFNVIDNGLNLNSAAGVPTNWTNVTPAGFTNSIVATAAPQVGNWAVIASTAGNAGATASLSRVLNPASWASGETLRFTQWVQFSCPDAGGIPEFILLRNGAVVDYLLMFPDAASASWDTGGTPYLFSIDYTIPAATASLTVYNQLVATAGIVNSYQFAQCTIENLSRNAIPL